VTCRARIKRTGAQYFSTVTPMPLMVAGSEFGIVDAKLPSPMVDAVSSDFAGHDSQHYRSQHRMFTL
jgi:hypothetical protein